MKSGFSLFMFLVSISAFATEKIQDNSVVECILGVHGHDTGEVYQKNIKIPSDGSITGPVFVELPYMDKELLLKLRVYTHWGDKNFYLNLFDSFEIGRLDPEDSDNTKKMWPHSLGMLGFTINDSSKIPTSFIEVKVAGAQQGEDGLTAYVSCGASIN